MRTGRSLTVCCSLIPRGGLPGPGGGSLCLGGLPGPGGGGSLPGGVCLVPGGLPRDPPVNRITDTCKNITLATTSLRPVINITTRMHSRMRTGHSSTITGAGGVSMTETPLWTDKRFWKHYPPATSFAGGKYYSQETTLKISQFSRMDPTCTLGSQSYVNMCHHSSPHVCTAQQMNIINYWEIASSINNTLEN